MAKTNSPVSSFGPELMSALRSGANTRSEYDFPTPQMAFRFMSRINALRAAMRREKHDLSDAVMRAGIKIAKKENPCRVIIEPRDSEFASAIKRVGEVVLESSQLGGQPTQPVSSLVEYATPSEDSADSFLSGLEDPAKDPS